MIGQYFGGFYEKYPRSRPLGDDELAAYFEQRISQYAAYYQSVIEQYAQALEEQRVPVTKEEEVKYQKEVCLGKIEYLEGMLSGLKEKEKSIQDEIERLKKSCEEMNAEEKNDQNLNKSPE